MSTSRRSFLKLLAFLPGVGALSQGARQALAGKPMLCNVFSVAGFQYYDGPDLLTDPLASMQPGDALDLRAEPENPYDAYAVELYWQGRKLGYVPRSDNKHISRLLRQGARLQATIKAVNREARSWHAVRAAVYVVV